MGVDFIKWADEDSVVKIISNVYAFAKKYIDRPLRVARNISATW